MELLNEQTLFCLFRLWLGIVLALIIHEFGHTLAAYLLKVEFAGVTLTPVAVGPRLKEPDKVSGTQNFWIALAGPATSLIFLTLLILPVPSATLRVTGAVGLGMNILMILPVGSFDGGRLFISLLEGKGLAHHWCAFLILGTLVSLLSLARFTSAYIALLIGAFLLIDLVVGFFESRKEKEYPEPDFVNSTWRASGWHFIAYFLTLAITWLGFWYFGGIDGIIAAIELLTVLPW